MRRIFKALCLRANEFNRRTEFNSGLYYVIEEEGNRKNPKAWLKFPMLQGLKGYFLTVLVFDQS